MKKRKKKKKKGLTIVGVLIGITILTIALAAQIRLLSSTIKRQAYVRNSVVATNLAREGIEILFMARSTLGWNNLRMNYKDKNLCTDIANVQNLTMYLPNFCKEQVLKFSEKQIFKGFYYEVTEGSELTRDIPSFWRTMKISSCDPVDDENCLLLKSTVGWENEELYLEKKIYNWYIP